MQWYDVSTTKVFVRYKSLYIADPDCIQSYSDTMQCSSLSVSDSWYWQKSPKKSGKHIHVACPLLSSQVPFPQ